MEPIDYREKAKQELVDWFGNAMQKALFERVMKEHYEKQFKHLRDAVHECS